jgi:glutamate dehydrogenase (NADP+)
MMTRSNKLNLKEFMEGLVKRNPGESEFHQAVEEVAMSVIPYINENPRYIENQILERMTEPDRTIIFRVCWEDDEGQIRTNRGYRVQFNNSIGRKCDLEIDNQRWLATEQKIIQYGAQ